MKTANADDEAAQSIVDEIIEENRVDLQWLGTLTCPMDRLNFCLDRGWHALALTTFHGQFFCEAGFSRDLAERMLLAMARQLPLMMEAPLFGKMSAEMLVDQGSMTLGRELFSFEPKDDADGSQTEKIHTHFLKHVAASFSEVAGLLGVAHPEVMAGAQIVVSFLKQPKVQQSMRKVRLKQDSVRETTGVYVGQLFRGWGAAKHWAALEQWMHNQFDSLDEQHVFLERVLTQTARREEYDVFLYVDQWVDQQPHRQETFDRFVDRQRNPQTTSLKGHVFDDFESAVQILMKAHLERKEIRETKQMLTDAVSKTFSTSLRKRM